MIAAILDLRFAIELPAKSRFDQLWLVSSSSSGSHFG